MTTTAPPKFEKTADLFRWIDGQVPRIKLPTLDENQIVEAYVRGRGYVLVWRKFVFRTIQRAGYDTKPTEWLGQIKNGEFVPKFQYRNDVKHIRIEQYKLWKPPKPKPVAKPEKPDVSKQAKDNGKKFIDEQIAALAIAPKLSK